MLTQFSLHGNSTLNGTTYEYNYNIKTSFKDFLFFILTINYDYFLNYIRVPVVYFLHLSRVHGVIIVILLLQIFSIGLRRLWRYKVRSFNVYNSVFIKNCNIMKRRDNRRQAKIVKKIIFIRDLRYIHNQYLDTRYIWYFLKNDILRIYVHLLVRRYSIHLYLYLYRRLAYLLTKYNAKCKSIGKLA